MPIFTHQGALQKGQKVFELDFKTVKETNTRFFIEIIPNLKNWKTSVLQK